MTYQMWLLTFTFLALAAFVIRGLFLGRQVSARVQKQGGSPFLGHLPMEFAYWLLSPIQKLATALKLSPNFFSWMCLFLGLASGIAAGFGAMSEAGILCTVSALFDTLDGMVARARGVASDAGEVLDASIDRYTEFFFLSGLVYYYRFDSFYLFLVLTALLGSFMVSYSQAKSEALQIEIPSGWMRRPERAAYLAGGAFLSPLISPWIESIIPRVTTFESLFIPQPHYPLLLALALVAIFANATAVVRFQVMYKKLKNKKSSPLK